MEGGKEIPSTENNFMIFILTLMEKIYNTYLLYKTLSQTGKYFPMVTNVIVVEGYEQQYDYQQAGNNISSLGHKMSNSYGGGGAQAPSGNINI